MLSIISVYHKKEILEEFLLKSLKTQSVKFELITVDNTTGRFKSVTEALNYGIKQIKHDSQYIMFIHPDVDLCSARWLEDAEKILDSIPNLGIAGVAGMSEKGGSNQERGRNIIKHGIPPIVWPWGNSIKKPKRVQTVDECLMIIPKPLFNKLQFDKEVCDNLHLYAVDWCLSIKRLGFDVYVIPMFIYHRSAGYSMSKEYYLTLKKVLKKHKKHYKHIYTTMGDWSTLYPIILQRLVKVGKILFSKFFR